MTSDTYIFSSSQLKTMLIGSGYREIVGLNLATEKLDYNKFVVALNELVRSGALYTENEEFLMSENVREIITTLGQAKWFDLIRTKKTSLADICCYRTHRIMIVRNVQANKEWYSFSSISSEDFCNILLDDGYLPPDNAEDLFYDEDLEEFEDSFVFDPLSTIGEDIPVLFSLDISVNIDNHTYMRVIDYHFFRYIVLYDGKEMKRCAYSKDIFKKVFLSLMER